MQSNSNEPTVIDLTPYTGGEKVGNLSGHERGVAARKAADLDAKDRDNQIYAITAPESLYSIAPSFFLGMFSESISHLGGRTEFEQKYQFQLKQSLLRQVNQSIERCLITTHK